MEKVWKARGSGSGGAGWREREKKKGGKGRKRGGGGEGGITLLELRPPSSQRVYADKRQTKQTFPQAPRKKDEKSYEKIG